MYKVEMNSNVGGVWEVHEFQKLLQFTETSTSIWIEHSQGIWGSGKLSFRDLKSPGKVGEFKYRRQGQVAQTLLNFKVMVIFFINGPKFTIIIFIKGGKNRRR